MEYCDGKNSVPPVNSGYEDKAEIRRKTVGSQNPYEKTEVASMDISMSEFNKGYQMLKKLGWKEGETLGLKNSGISDPKAGTVQSLFLFYIGKQHPVVQNNVGIGNVHGCLLPLSPDRHYLFIRS
ncbi:hypothetical protein AVEN_45943-1 [Araneus ventricosus]|uniref:G-patch domain-containing protein n=1 Tax=Araneus ventricosus TaxID=182803 RepID=A0A4Y2GBT5_ARAVE|nr:hypothetical protein AVEN_45943-1 [Araneus ventricosus]